MTRPARAWSAPDGTSARRYRGDKPPLAGYGNIAAVLEARPPSVATDRSAEHEGTVPGAGTDLEQPDALATAVAKAVRGLRAAAGLSERAAARLLGTSQTQLRRMEDPRYLPSLRSLARVAKAYGHDLRIEFEPRDRQPAKPVKAAPRPKPAAPRAKRAPASRSARPGRQRRRA